MFGQSVNGRPVSPVIKRRRGAESGFKIVADEKPSSAASIASPDGSETDDWVGVQAAGGYRRSAAGKIGHSREPTPRRVVKNQLVPHTGSLSEVAK